MAIKIENIIEKLKMKRPVFHSEADFQHSFAWELQLEHPLASIRLEKPFVLDSDKIRQAYLDIFITEGDDKYAIELKYKTSGLEVSIGGEYFHIKNHGAHRDNRGHFLTDIHRLEKMKETGQANYAYSIMITNESLYWTSPIIEDNRYTLNWEDYSLVNESKKAQFKLLLLKI